jgi:hypothetical protein
LKRRGFSREPLPADRGAPAAYTEAGALGEMHGKGSVMSANNDCVKILPVKYPMISTFQDYACLLAILSSHEETYDWIYSHYIQAYFIKTISKDGTTDMCHAFFQDHDIRPVGFAYHGYSFNDQTPCPFIRRFHVPIQKDDMSKDELISLLKGYIDKSFYIMIFGNISRIKEYGVDWG